MKRRNFLKAAFSIPIAVGLFGADLTRSRRSSESILASPGSKRSRWINLVEIDDDTLGRWWADLNAFELPKEFGKMPSSVNAEDYLRGRFRVVNALTPEETANKPWLAEMAPYLEEWEREKSRSA